MGNRSNLLTCAASLGFFALGAALGGRRARRRERRLAALPPCSGGASAVAAAATPGGAPGAPPGAAACGAGDDGDNAHARRAALDCPVCLGELVLPRVAPCGHTLCSTCLAALFAHERRPACPVCRKRIRAPVEKLPVNFVVKAVVEARVAARGEGALRAYREVEEEAKRVVRPYSGREDRQRQNVVAQLRPAWNWFKWTIIIVTEFGAFLVSLKEVLESAPARRRYQRIV